ncbi:hypothetical protein KVR01_007237 [Diaporthe batatas]|uniref:uncharacterized protein n=1 Tax=Diaporthe batatas TaxID=748121 RepID=UPI001D03EDC4|nr:uncharacterized protein KVR01_007237 [Diaporthe batatas]KAG8162759.1 hypothetical protein KVR01_007237 [Diaporthe batatas]
MSGSAGRQPGPSHMEPSNTGNSRAHRSKPFVHYVSPKGKQIAHSASAVGEQEPRDKSVCDNPDDSSSNSSVDSYDELDEIDPEDSISVSGKQQHNHRTKRNAFLPKDCAHQHQHQHQQEQPQPVPSSISVEFGPAGRQGLPYSYNSLFGPGPQGGAGWVPRVPPPAPYYGNAGYMPPNQDHYTTPYWQQPSYEEWNDMMHYPMWNPFAPGQGGWPPPAAPVGRPGRSHRARNRSVKTKERHLSNHALDAESRPAGSVADRRSPGKGPGKSGDDVDVLRLAADVDAVYTSVEARDLSVHLEFDLFRDLDEELEDFSRLFRMGNFIAAESFFESHLKEHMSSDPSIFVQYAEMLLEKGDFKSLLLLDGNSVFGRRGPNGRKDPEKSEVEEQLEINWMLVRARALIHSQHELHTVWHGITIRLFDDCTASDINSTELRNLSMSMRMICLASDRTIPRDLKERELSDWAGWKSIYRQLLAEQRIWDFRDVLIDACISYDTDQALNAFIDHTSPIEGMVADWQTGTPDESTELALLDLLTFIALHSDQSLEDGRLVGDCLRLAEPIGHSLLDNFPHTVNSRPFIQWLISKAVVKNAFEHFAYLSDYAGLAICPKSAAGLPHYIPIRQENPGWLPHELNTAARDILQATLKASRDMKDYQTEALCLKSLALGTKDPVAYFQQLGQLQKNQQNMGGFLSTCLTRYLICHDDESKKVLLDDLNSFGSWKDASDLFDPIGAASRDVLQHALSRRPGAESPIPSIMSASKYSLHLPEHFKSIFRYTGRPRLTETGEHPRPPTEISLVEQHSESEDEPQESPERNTRSRNARNNGGSRVGKKFGTKEKHHSAAPGFYPGPWPSYGVPPFYFPMNMMHRAQAPPPPEWLPRPPPPPPTVQEYKPSPEILEIQKQLEILQAERRDREESKKRAEMHQPPPTTEEHRPSPQMEEMKKQLEHLKAERREQQESKKRADMEQRIRQETEHTFKIRMEEMLKAQEVAKKEIELTKVAAERAARERLEEEHKAEAERQRQIAELIAKAERDAEKKYDAALKAEERHRRQATHEMREQMREEMRLEMRALARRERERMEDELQRRGPEQSWAQSPWEGRQHMEGERAREER